MNSKESDGFCGENYAITCSFLFRREIRMNFGWKEMKQYLEKDTKPISHFEMEKILKKYENMINDFSYESKISISFN